MGLQQINAREKQKGQNLASYNTSNISSLDFIFLLFYKGLQNSCCAMGGEKFSYLQADNWQGSSKEAKFKIET